MSASRLAALACTVLLVAACSIFDSVVPLPDAGPPAKFEFSIGGFGTGSSFVWVRGDTVLFRRLPFDFSPSMKIDTVRVVPTADAWRTFWSSAKAAGLERWNAKYEAKGIIDGVGWGMHIVAGGNTLDATGSNAYPDRDGDSHEGDMTAEFRAFLSALDQLVGRKVFL